MLALLIHLSQEEYACRVVVTAWQRRCGEIDLRKSKISLSMRGFCYPPTRSGCFFRHDDVMPDCEEIVCRHTTSKTPVLDLTGARRIVVDPSINPGVKIIRSSISNLRALPMSYSHSLPQ